MTDEDNVPTDQKKPSRVQKLVLKVLMLVVFALLVGMCSFKYIS